MENQKGGKISTQFKGGKFELNGEFLDPEICRYQKTYLLVYYGDKLCLGIENVLPFPHFLFSLAG